MSKKKITNANELLTFNDGYSQAMWDVMIFMLEMTNNNSESIRERMRDMIDKVKKNDA